MEITEIDDLLALQEAAVPNLRPGCEKRVIWAGEPCLKTPFALLYVHGFSASPEELRPLPDLIAKGIDANIHFTRLTGHGQDGAALANARFEDWQADMVEALEIARTIGDEVIIMGCSTGCTMASFSLAGGTTAKAMIHVSPNFGLRHKLAQTLMDMPFARHWGPYVAGRTRSFDPVNEAHTAYWTTSYPTRAVFAMADAVRAVRGSDLGAVQTPAAFAYNPDDDVVSAAEIKKVMARWGGPVTEMIVTPTADDDASGHVMAGDIFSPGQTEPLAARILAWFRDL